MKIQARGARHEARGKNRNNVTLTTRLHRGELGTETIPGLIGVSDLVPRTSCLVPSASRLPKS